MLILLGLMALGVSIWLYGFADRPPYKAPIYEMELPDEYEP